PLRTALLPKDQQAWTIDFLHAFKDRILQVKAQRCSLDYTAAWFDVELFEGFYNNVEPAFEQQSRFEAHHCLRHERCFETLFDAVLMPVPEPLDAASHDAQEINFPDVVFDGLWCDGE